MKELWVGNGRSLEYCCGMGPIDIKTRSPDGGQPGPLAELAAAELVVSLRAMSRALQALLAAQARASGLPLLEFLILIRAVEEEGVIARDVGQALGLNTSTMTGLADRLETDKLIRRAPHPSDRRLLVLKATAKGQRTVEHALGPLLAQLTELAGRLQGDQQVILGGFLTDVSALVLQHAQAARPRPTRRAVARAAAAG